ncbi:MAG TPA: hypothetical protein VFA65_15140, partial [Bryobacteraceae bacterium]|nr:hypothetical protein [Bryobacteraceae bacterium]
VVLEIAQLLKQRGEKIALLALLDSYPDARYWPLRSWISVIIRRFFEQAHSVVKLPPRQAISRVTQLSGGLIEHVRRRKGALPQWVREGQSEQGGADKVHRLRHACMIAMGRYTPRYYDGKVVFLKSELSTRFPSSPVAIWRDLVRSLEIHRVPGDHLAIIAAHVDIVGAHLSSSIDHGLRESS